MEENKALGMIEVKGRIGAVEGLDNALKAADVALVNMIKTGGGLTAFFIEGDVGAVKAAIESGAAAARKTGQVISAHVIPRPAECVRGMLRQEPDSKEDDPEGDVPKEDDPEEGVPKEDVPKEDDPEGETETEEPKSPDLREGDETGSPSNPLELMTVAQLRALAREMEQIPMSRQEIKFAKKGELIEAIDSCAETHKV